MDPLTFTEDTELRKRRMLPQTLGGMLTTAVQPGQATVMPQSSRAYLGKVYEELSQLDAKPEDLSEWQEFARKRADDGEGAMLNALAASIAGERFQPLQAHFLKQASAARDPMKIGAGLLTPDGKIIRDPTAQREARRAALERQATTLQGMVDRQEKDERDRQDRRERDQRDYALKETLAQFRMQGGGDKPYFQPVQTAQGVYAFNSRTGRMEPIAGGDGQPIIGAAADPTLQGQIAGAKTAGQKNAESAADARAAVKRSTQMLEALDQAERLLLQNPTASNLGALRDAAGNVIGVSSQSADTAAKLESISGWLTANVPRMEGPQSNFDVQNYQVMAGMVGDRTKPVRQRLAALQEVRKLQEKYRDLNEGSAAPAANTQPKAPAAGLTAAEQAELEALRKKFGR